MTIGNKLETLYNTAIMKKIDKKILGELYRAKKDSHKGQNGKLLVIGGSELFHSASLWALEVASRVVDMVFYSSVPVNKEIVRKQKQRFHDGIVVPEGKLDSYIKEADCVLIGPGMVRGGIPARGTGRRPLNYVKVLEGRGYSPSTAINKLLREGETGLVVNYLLKKYPDKRWVVDGGALQMMDRKLLNEKMIITPHKKEFKRLFGGGIRPLKGKEKLKSRGYSPSADINIVKKMAKKYSCTIALKGEQDVVCNSKECVVNTTGNEGMTKGGTGDVLAGLIAALYCKNEAMLAASCGVYINGLAGDRLYGMVGPYFNATELMNEIPKVMGEGHSRQRNGQAQGKIG